MRSLLWCEWRTKRLWFFALTAALVAPVLFGDPLTFWGGYVAAAPNEGWFYFSDALLPAMVVGLLFGLMGFSGELGAGNQDFLFSRPVSWKKFLAAKLVFALGIMMLTILISAAAFRFVCPPQYLPFVTASRLLGGIAGALAFTAGPYLVGLCCSVVFPGAVGAILMMLAVAVAMGAEIALIPAVDAAGKNSALRVFTPWIVGLALAALVVVRFGLTLSVPQRVKRYALVVLSSVVCLSWATIPLHEVRKTSVHVSYNFSPDMSNAIVVVDKGSDYEVDRSKSYFWRLKDNVRKDFDSDSIDPGFFLWLNDSTACNVQSPISYPGGVCQSFLEIMDMDKSGKLILKDIVLGQNVYQGSEHFISPDGRTIVFYQLLKDKGGARHSKWRFWDVESEKWLPQIIDRPFHIRTMWWQNNNELAWLDRSFRRHVVRVR